MSDFIDDDGYPTEEALERVLGWEQRGPEDGHALLAFVREIWWSAQWGFHHRDTKAEFGGGTERVYSLSTGGWSGNEEIVRALMENRGHAWFFWWESSRRGGHYTFRIPAFGSRQAAPK